jgi:hypothetical protein
MVVWIVMTIWTHALSLFLINLPFLTYYYEESSVDVTSSDVVKQNSMTVCSLARKYKQFGETYWSCFHCRHQQSMKHLYKAAWNSVHNKCCLRNTEIHENWIQTVCYSRRLLFATCLFHNPVRSLIINWPVSDNRLVHILKLLIPCIFRNIHL